MQQTYMTHGGSQSCSDYTPNRIHLHDPVKDPDHLGQTLISLSLGYLYCRINAQTSRCRRTVLPSGRFPDRWRELIWLATLNVKSVCQVRCIREDYLPPKLCTSVDLYIVMNVFINAHIVELCRMQALLHLGLVLFRVLGINPGDSKTVRAVWVLCKTKEACKKNPPSRHKGKEMGGGGGGEGSLSKPREGKG